MRRRKHSHSCFGSCASGLVSCVCRPAHRAPNRHGCDAFGEAAFRMALWLPDQAGWAWVAVTSVELSDGPRGSLVPSGAATMRTCSEVNIWVAVGTT
eukprot:scaffold55221_cov28-Tisochrysis_lutea.AAC.4